MIKEIDFESYETSVPDILKKAGFDKKIKKEKKIILKPNLVVCKKAPTTTPVEFVEEVVKFIKKNNDKVKILIAEGSAKKTGKCFKKLGYFDLAEKYDLELVDLNKAETMKVKSREFLGYDFIEYPRVLLDGFLVSLPVLKEHSCAWVTISLKNMIGAFPMKYYRTFGHVARNVIHKKGVDYSIHDIVACKMPDFAICDASVGQLGNETGGTAKEFGKLLAGDCIDVDKKGAEILGCNWKDVKHLVLVDELLKGDKNLKKK